jgi:histidine triad (HIT) family protein
MRSVAHSSDLRTVSEEDLHATISAARKLAERAIERLGAEGQPPNSCGGRLADGVPLHVHVIPRYAADPLRLPWVPSEGDPRQIALAAEELAAT